MQTVSWEKLVDFGVRLLTHKGVPEANARYVAEAAVKTEAFGIQTHGLAVLPYLDAVLVAEIDAKAEPEIVREKGATALIEGNSAIGQLAVKLAVELATAKAKTYGTAMVAASNVSWIGALGVHLMPLVEEGLLAQLWAQSSACKDCAPFGGIDARFSTNPVAIAFPTGADPMIGDFSTAAVSMGKVAQMVRQGEKAKAPIFMDKDGMITDNPEVVQPEGSILFFGGETQGHKGYALSLWCEALTAVAGGNCNNPERPQRQSFALSVADPDAFAGRDYYEKEIARFVKHVKSSRARPGFQAIRLPGERGFRSLREARRSGLPLEAGTIEKLEAVAKKNNMAGVL